LATPGRRETQDRAQRGCLAGAIPPEKGHALRRPDGQRNALENVTLPIIVWTPLILSMVLPEIRFDHLLVRLNFILPARRE
jgi:hypothetical protein